VTLKSAWHKPALLSFFGNKPIPQIDDQDILDYRDGRATQKIIKHQKRVGKICQPHAVVLGWETALSCFDLFQLAWSEIDLKEGIIELRDGRVKTHKPQAIPIYTPELSALISELQQRRRRVPNAAGLVLTMDGQPIDKLKFQYLFRRACTRAKINGFTFHDLRHCAISRWVSNGVPTAAAMLAAGHSVASHKGYQNLTKNDLKAAFIVLPNCSQEKSEQKESAASS